MRFPLTNSSSSPRRRGSSPGPQSGPSQNPKAPNSQIPGLHSSPVPCKRKAFTLIELLIVLATLGLLSAILFPVFGRVRASGRRTVCISQLRQLGLAFQMYGGDYNRQLPSRISLLYPAYQNDARLFICPEDRNKGQFTGNERMETNQYLPGGVSYEYVPNWILAHEKGWYNPAPRYGPGKWDDMTPLVGCMWHWAKFFDPHATTPFPTTKGWQLYLLKGGAVRRARVEEGLENLTPEKLR